MKKMNLILTSIIGIYMVCFHSSGCSRSQPTNETIPTDVVAFVNKSGMVNHIWMMDLNSSGIGSNTRRLTNDPESENYPSWSPDGKSILYQRDHNGSAIYIVDADGRNARRLSPTPGFDVTPSWSPNGTKIIYARVLGFVVPNQIPRTEIRVMNADGTDDHAILPSNDFSVEPRWSVNNEVVFMSHMNDTNGPLHIFTMLIDGTNIRQLTHEGNSGDPVWSPDGTQISFGSDREENNKLNIFVMNSKGSNVRQLTHFDVPVESGIRTGHPMVPGLFLNGIIMEKNNRTRMLTRRYG